MPQSQTRSLPWMAIVTAGVLAAMHIWKLPGALEGIRTDFGMSLVTAGTLLGVVQVGSMLLGLVLLAAIAATVGGRQLSWVVTASASALGIALAALLLRRRVLAASR